jgi:hypothetical protein
MMLGLVFGMAGIFVLAVRREERRRRKREAAEKHPV